MFSDSTNDISISPEFGSKVSQAGWILRFSNTSRKRSREIPSHPIPCRNHSPYIDRLPRSALSIPRRNTGIGDFAFPICIHVDCRNSEKLTREEREREKDRYPGGTREPVIPGHGRARARAAVCSIRKIRALCVSWPADISSSVSQEYLVR